VSYAWEGYRTIKKDLAAVFNGSKVFLVNSGDINAYILQLTLYS
jgi:hypothetical protein